MSILLLCVERLHATNLITGLLLTALAAGLGLGSVSAAVVSKDHIELGMAPCASFSLGLLCLWLSAAQSMSLAINMLGVVLASGVFWLLRGGLAFSATAVVGTIGVLTHAATLYIVYIDPMPSLRLLCSGAIVVFSRLLPANCSGITRDDMASIGPQFILPGDVFIRSYVKDHRNYSLGTCPDSRSRH
jgi:hypothetical protein